MTENETPVRPGYRPGPPPAPCRNWALFLDIDGTLLDVAPRPDEVTVPPALREHLAQAAETLGGALALVSGRPIGDIDRLFAPLRLPASGQHGSEWRAAPDLATEVVAAQPVPPDLREIAEALRALDPGIVVEQKSHALAVHYRDAPELGPALGEKLRQALNGHAGMALMPGKLVWEVKDASQTKGTAVSRFMAEPRFAGRRPVFIGDDRTDEDGFRAAEALGGLALPVGARVQHWTHPGGPGFTGPAAVREWLADFAQNATGASA